MAAPSPGSKRKRKSKSDKNIEHDKHCGYCKKCKADGKDAHLSKRSGQHKKCLAALGEKQHPQCEEWLDRKRRKTDSPASSTESKAGVISMEQTLATKKREYESRLARLKEETAEVETELAFIEKCSTLVKT